MAAPARPWLLTFGTATHEVKRLDLATNTADVITGEGGDIRRTKHGDMLVATPAWAYSAGEAFKITAPNSAAPTVQWGFFSQPDARGEAAIGLQPLVYELLPATSTRSLNQKRYELADHLGNVRAVVSDRKLCDNAALPTPPTAYRAEVLNQTDYYPFGMISNATTASGGDYRFGFNSQEKDDEVFGATGTAMTAEFWEYDTRTGRRWNLDPVDQVSISNYAAFGLNPIINVDPNGAWFWESKNVRQARQFARSTGGDFEKHRSYFTGKMNASVTLGGRTGETVQTGFGEENMSFDLGENSIARFTFCYGQDRSDLVDAAGGDLYDRMQANTTGFESLGWALKGLDYATQPGHTPPAAIQAFISLNPIIGAGNVYSGLTGGTDVWGQEQGAGGTALNAAAIIPLGGLVRSVSTAVNVTSRARTVNQALSLGERWLGPGYTEFAKGPRGVFFSADGLRSFRMTSADLLPTHGKLGPHVHFELFNAGGTKLKNFHVPLLDP